jgi:hypothetical protein
MNKTEQDEDEIVASLAVYKELSIRLQKQSSATMKLYNTWKIHMISGVEEGLQEITNAAISEFWKLEEIEEAIAPYIQRGFPQPRYEKPAIDEIVREDVTDQWADWRKEANVVQANSDRGIKNGFQR